MRRPGWFAARAVLAIGLALGCLAPAAGAAARPLQAQSPVPKGYILVNAETGQVLLAENEHEALPPASTAKIMTALTAIERLPADATITVSELAAAQPASRINMIAGNQWRFEDALASLIIVSANDAAYAIAENAGGSLEGFAAAMTATAERLGMRDSTFSDPAGFDDQNSFGGGPRMSAFDIAVAARNAMAVPQVAQLAATVEMQFVDPTGATRTLTNHNKMLPGNSRGYEGATGFKTGYTDQAGNTFVGTAERNGCSLIAVVLNTWDTYGWAAQLLDQGFTMNCQATGSAARLPDVAVWPYAQRVDDRRGFVALARGPNNATTTTTVPTTSSVDAAVPLAAQSEPGTDDGSAAGQTGGAGASGLMSLRNVGVVAVVVLAVLVTLRRRAVKRQRMRRLARRRMRAAQMRSGGLTIVDGRYRTGTRVGPPVESHVQVRRLRDE